MTNTQHLLKNKQILEKSYSLSVLGNV